MHEKTTATEAWKQLEDRLIQAQSAIQQGHSTRLDHLLADTRALIANQMNPAPSAAQQQRLQQLYQRLILIIEAQKQTIGTQLKQLRGGKQAVKAYHGNL